MISKLESNKEVWEERVSDGMKKGREIIRKRGRAIESEKRKGGSKGESYEYYEGVFKLRRCKRCIRQRMDKLMR